jgi:hypothetical protein
MLPTEAQSMRAACAWIAGFLVTALVGCTDLASGDDRAQRDAGDLDADVGTLDGGIRGHGDGSTDADVADSGDSSQPVRHDASDVPGGDAETGGSDGGMIVPDSDGGLVIPEDPGGRGPWPVGVRTVMLPLGGGQVPVEIWYPATPGSEDGHDKHVFDFIKWLPPEAQEDVPSGDKPVPVYCDCYRDLPIDAAHGPYPVSIFVHNIGAFRTESAGIMEHWASRGFIVAALDHPKLTLQDALAFTSLGACTGSGVTEDTTRKRDVSALLGVLREPSAGFSFLDGAVDAAHVAVSGHSDGARYAADTSGEPGVRLIMLWNNAVTVTKQGDLEAIAYFAGGEDRSSGGAYATVEAKFLDTEPPALFVGTNDVGNLSMTELCNATNSLGRDGMDIAQRYELCGIDYTLLAAGWDCNSAYLDQPTANAVFNLATTAALEQFLKGNDSETAWARFRAEYGEVRLSL